MGGSSGEKIGRHGTGYSSKVDRMGAKAWLRGLGRAWMGGLRLTSGVVIWV